MILLTSGKDKTQGESRRVDCLAEYALDWWSCLQSRPPIRIARLSGFGLMTSILVAAAEGTRQAGLNQVWNVPLLLDGEKGGKETLSVHGSTEVFIR